MWFQPVDFLRFVLAKLTPNRGRSPFGHLFQNPQNFRRDFLILGQGVFFEDTLVGNLFRRDSLPETNKKPPIRIDEANTRYLIHQRCDESTPKVRRWQYDIAPCDLRVGESNTTKGVLSPWTSPPERGDSLPFGQRKPQKDSPFEGVVLTPGTSPSKRGESLGQRKKKKETFRGGLSNSPNPPRSVLCQSPKEMSKPISKRKPPRFARGIPPLAGQILRGFYDSQILPLEKDLRRFNKVKYDVVIPCFYNLCTFQRQFLKFQGVSKRSKPLISPLGGDVDRKANLLHFCGKKIISNWYSNAPPQPPQIWSLNPQQHRRQELKLGISLGMAQVFKSIFSLKEKVKVISADLEKKEFQIKQ
eukprot:TRINITY_DN3888_c0_g1_i6.p1 TRINITY_DN3888_c0_g1~~TRINITY_DN3888_c0_g1_i6.p1  ORF type:complete len:359 (-),score=37.47 TRINITY_DN3888_c0_g1_i6:131-1207(-)